MSVVCDDVLLRRYKKIIVQINGIKSNINWQCLNFPTPSLSISLFLMFLYYPCLSIYL